MFKNFDGQSKVKPLVSLRGASKKEERDALIRKNLEERRQRELFRRQTSAATKIQAFYRSCRVRAIEKSKCRLEFDKDLSSYVTNGPMLSSSIAKFNFFFNKKFDNERFLFLSRYVLQLPPGDVLGCWNNSHVDFTRHMKHLIINCCKLLENLLECSGQIGSHLRFLQAFATLSFYETINSAVDALTIFNFVAEKGYFGYIKVLLEKRIPSSLEISSSAPTPLAEAIRDLIAEPLVSLLTQATASARTNAMACFVKDILVKDLCPQVSNYLLLALAKKIPCQVWIDTLHSYLSSDGLTDEGSQGLWMCYILLNASTSQQSKWTDADLGKYLFILRRIMAFSKPAKALQQISDDEDSDSDDDDMSPSVIQDPTAARLAHFKDLCLEILTSSCHVQMLLSVFEVEQKSVSISMVQNVCGIFLPLLNDDTIPRHRMRLLCLLAFNSIFLRCLWLAVKTMKSTSETRKHVNLLSSVCSGNLHADDHFDIVPVFSVFACLFRHALFSLHDADLVGDVTKVSSPRDTSVPFMLEELIDMSKILVDVVIGLLDCTYSEAVIASQHGKSTGRHVVTPLHRDSLFLCQNVTLLVRQIYARDCRRYFCPSGHWLSSRAMINVDQFDVQSFFDEDGPGTISKPSSSMLARRIAIIKHIPFSVEFRQRVKIFQRILEHDKNSNESRIQAPFMPESNLGITVNRNHLYQNAFDQLSRHQVADVKKVIRVKMINAQGLDEAGIDGGGLFREFLGQLLIQGFDPSYGFFKVTSEQLLYPNPHVAKIFPNSTEHFHFLGRMLGKAIYENMLVELPFAGFFLCKLLSRSNSDVDIHHLELLDPELYRNLLYLRKYNGDIEDLALNFTVNNNDFGEAEVIELKPGGKDIAVSSNNKLEYIHLIADYRLNKQIRPQCNAFRAGLSDVISFDWLQMFDHNELQVIISGASNPIDLEDMRAHTTYSSGYKDDEPYIDAFWDILEDTTDVQRRKFLKFVTSCSRPPLLGFKELWPAFCVHFGGEEDRLPSASTCMNLLKLPRYQTVELLKTRLLYAIESEAGFELS